MKRLLFLIAIVLLISLVSALLLSLYVIRNTGNIGTVNVQVFADEACTVPLVEIDWGTIYVGQSKSNIGYVWCDSPELLTLSMTYGNFTPAEAGDILTLTWNLENATLQPRTPLQAVFTLAVGNATSNMNFTFDILVMGSA